MADLINDLIKDGWLKTPAIIKAFKEIKRSDFLRDGIKDMAELNSPLPIGFRQTISQPLTVAFMLELLQPKAGDRILDVGYGSGWTSALLADIVGRGNKKGKVISIEIIPKLKEFGERNIMKYNFIKKGTVECILGDGSKGRQKSAPFDAILASASGKGKIPAAWKKQLAIGGRIVAPMGESIWLLEKKEKNKFEEKEYPGFIFVPLIEK
ncbi:MAG: protein-L-isoaspartate O-methyltransferase [Candidatus Parcubacteria bacterium]|nr:protein-L-isoaspartate O-methyltransferase [Candidatus Parcubacteria bacterium]